MIDHHERIATACKRTLEDLPTAPIGQVVGVLLDEAADVACGLIEGLEEVQR